MNEQAERQIVRAVTGELSAAELAELRRRLAADPDLAAAERRLARAWSELDLPAEAPPLGFATRVMAAVRSQRAASSAGWSALPRWAKAAAAVALAAGIALGAGLGFGASAASADSGEATALWSDPGDGESFWLTEAPSAEANGGESDGG